MSAHTSGAKLANDLRLNPDALLPRIRELAVMLPDNLADIRQPAGREGLDHSLMTRLSDALQDRARRCIQAIDMSEAATDR
jgi:hypothetical protein